MNLLMTILMGFLSGWIAGILTKGHGLGIVGNIVVGVVGATVGNYVLGKFGIAFHGFWGNVATAVIGAMLLLFLIRLIKKI